MLEKETGGRKADELEKFGEFGRTDEKKKHSTQNDISLLIWGDYQCPTLVLVVLCSLQIRMCLLTEASRWFKKNESNRMNCGFCIKSDYCGWKHAVNWNKQVVVKVFCNGLTVYSYYHTALLALRVFHINVNVSILKKQEYGRS